MRKSYCTLGLMSGTSLDGVDVSLILSDGEKQLEIVDNYHKKYHYHFKSQLKKLINKINKSKDVKKNEYFYKKLENKLTLYHVEACKKLIKSNFKRKIDFIGFHGQTILHDPKNKISIQMGNPNLLSKSLKKKVYFNFRQNDILSGGDGAPLTPIYHRIIFKKINLKLPVIFLNIGGIANITYINKKNEIISCDVGPGNCLIDSWIYKKINKDFDKGGKLAQRGKVNKNIILKEISKKKYLKSKSRSFDIKSFDTLFVKKLILEDGLATLADFSARLIAKKIRKINKNKIPIIVCGGGRKNKFLIKKIVKYIKNDLINIDMFGINGDYIESQAFAYLAIRSHLKKKISFPSTTGVKFPVSGGRMFENF